MGQRLRLTTIALGKSYILQLFVEASVTRHIAEAVFAAAVAELLKPYQ